MEKRPHKATGKPEELVHPTPGHPLKWEGRDIQGHCFPQAFRFLGHKVFIAKAGVVTDAGSLAGKLAKASKITSAPMEQFQSQEFIQQILHGVPYEVLTRLLTAACSRQQRLETACCLGVQVTVCMMYRPCTQLSPRQSENKGRKLSYVINGARSLNYTVSDKRKVHCYMTPFI